MDISVYIKVLYTTWFPGYHVTSSEIIQMYKRNIVYMVLRFSVLFILVVMWSYIVADFGYLALSLSHHFFERQDSDMTTEGQNEPEISTKKARWRQKKARSQQNFYCPSVAISPFFCRYLGFIWSLCRYIALFFRNRTRCLKAIASTYIYRYYY